MGFWSKGCMGRGASSAVVAFFFRGCILRGSIAIIYTSSMDTDALSPLTRVPGPTEGTENPTRSSVPIRVRLTMPGLPLEVGSGAVVTAPSLRPSKCLVWEPR